MRAQRCVETAQQPPEISKNEVQNAPMSQSLTNAPAASLPPVPPDNVTTPSSTKAADRRRRWLRNARIGIAVALLVLLLPTFANPEFFKALSSVNIPLVLVAFVFSVLSVASKARRWGIVLRARGINATDRYLLFSYFVSMFFNNFLPSAVGGDAVRAIESARSSGRHTESVSAVILERGTGMVTVFGCGSILALFTPNLPLQIALLAHGLFIGTIFGVFLLWRDFTGDLINWITDHLVARLLGGRLIGIWGKASGLYFDFRDYRHKWRLIGALMWQSIITQAMTISSLYALINAFNMSPPFGAFIAVTGIASAIDLIPISLNGIGIREGVYVYFLGLLLIPAPIAVAFALVNRLIVLAQAMLGGLTFLWRSARPAVPMSITPEPVTAVVPPAATAVMPSPVIAVQPDIEEVRS
jgi:hypothetical protein